MSIVVAVRVRPFNQREKDLNSRLCVRMRDNTTVLVDDSGAERSFSFDHSFWSHDGFEEQPDGYLSPVSPQFADQRAVYERVGRAVLDNALNGYNCTLFAYGQTGSGKSFSMVGFGRNRGIVPVATEELFAAVRARQTPQKRFEVSLSMLEIYNERIQDLLVAVGERPAGGLKVRESKTLGVYVEGLSKHPVGSYADIEARMADGFRTRTIAATQMNSCSSRAHTIIAVECKQVEFVGDRKLERLSVINLVDLAGSEKVAKTGAVGDRLREGCSINKSLTVLGLVITNLADIAMGRGKGRVVPYRDSSLTRILQNALGGNSKTLMICAVSPSSDNFEESLSTLRYADQAKRIKCHAIVNESESDSKLRELQRENDELKKLLETLKAGGGVGREGGLGRDGGGWREAGDGPAEALLKGPGESVEGLQRRLAEYENALKSNQMMIAEYEKSFEERLAEEGQKRGALKGETFDFDSAHLANLNEDPQLTGHILLNLDKLGTVLVGRRNGSPPPHIVLNAIGIQPNHARIERLSEGCCVEAASAAAEGQVYVNGVAVTGRQRLSHLDRLAFGISTFFLFRDRAERRPEKCSPSEAEVDWEFCQQELSRRNMDFGGVPGRAEEARSAAAGETLAEFEKETLRLKGEYEERLEQLRREHEETVERLRREAAEQTRVGEPEREQLVRAENERFAEFFQELAGQYQQKVELTGQKKEAAAKAVLAEFRERDKAKLERKLLKLSPNITELNLIAKELRRDVVFSPHFSYVYVEPSGDRGPAQHSRYKVQVRVENREAGATYHWDLNKFSSRYFLIKDLLHRFYETSALPSLPPEKDPFWDPPEPQKLGQCYLKLLSLAYLLDNPNELIVLGETGQLGTVNVNLVPVDSKGEPLDENSSALDDFGDDPEELLGRELRFQVRVSTADLPEELASDVSVCYALLEPDADGKLTKVVHETRKLPRLGPETDFGYVGTHVFPEVTPAVLDYLLTSNLCFELLGFPTTPKAREEKREAGPPSGHDLINDYNSKLLQSKLGRPPANQRPETVQNAQKNEKKKKKGLLGLFGL